MNVQSAAIRPVPAPIVRIEIAGEEIWLDRRGCALVPRLGLLVVSDLHLEKGSSLARRRRFLPPYDSHETMARLADVIKDHAPRMVVCLGDSFHDEEGHERLPETMRAEIRRLAAGREWCWIAGNHDPVAPAGLCGTSSIEFAAGPLVFRHEPGPRPGAGEIAGHLHPGAAVRRLGRSMRRPCFAADGQRLILPAFGAYTGTLNVRSAPISGLFDGSSFHAYVLGDAAIYPLSARALAAAC